MTGQSSRSYLAVASAIIIAGVLISASLFVAIGEAAKTTTIGTTGTSVSTTTETSISTTTQTVTTTTGVETSTVGTETSSLDSPGALRLDSFINATNLEVGQSLNVTLSIFNTFPAINTVLPSNDWLFQGVPVELWGYCSGAYPVEVAVLDGNYTLQELPSVANSTFTYFCAGYISVDQVIFQPDSDQANITGTGPGPGLNQTLGPFHLALSFGTTGYWDLGSLSKELNPPIIGAENSRPPSPTTFVPGTYTVAVEDEWGQAVVMHVTVSA